MEDGRPVVARGDDKYTGNELVDATAVAQFLGVTRGWVYSNADLLGARRLGTGPKARLRFDLAEVDRRLACLGGRQSPEPETRVVKPLRQGRRTRSTGTGVPLLPVKGVCTIVQIQNEAQA
jgi:hypothetical protein